MLSSGVGSCFQGFRIRFRLTRRLATFAPTRRRCHVATDATHKVVTWPEERRHASAGHEECGAGRGAPCPAASGPLWPDGAAQPRQHQHTKASCSLSSCTGLIYLAEWPREGRRDRQTRSEILPMHDFFFSHVSERFKIIYYMFSINPALDCLCGRE